MAEELITQEQIALDWLRISVERFQKAIKKFGIKSDIADTDSLIKSFESELKRAGGGSVAAALLKFKASGRFVDMGVGRGVPIGSQRAKADYFKNRNKKGQLHKYARKPKKWYSITLGGQVKKLGELMQEHFGVASVQLIESAMKNIKNEVTINFGNG